MCLHTVIAKVGDAGTNAMLLGIPNAIGTYNHENDYTTVEENRAYLQVSGVNGTSETLAPDT